MKLLPYDRFTLEANVLPGALQARLAAAVEPYKAIRWRIQDCRPYQGQVSDAGFKISRIIDYRNSFLPVIRGRFLPAATGTHVEITMELEPLVAVFLGVWLLFWYGATVPIFLLNGPIQPMALMFWGMPLVVMVAFWWAFWYEANRSRRELTQILLGTGEVV